MANIIWDPYAKTFRDSTEYLKERDEYYAKQKNAIKASEPSASMGDFRQLDAASGTTSKDSLLNALSTSQEPSFIERSEAWRTAKSNLDKGLGVGGMAEGVASSASKNLLKGLGTQTPSSMADFRQMDAETVVQNDINTPETSSNNLLKGTGVAIDKVENSKARRTAIGNRPGADNPIVNKLYGITDTIAESKPFRAVDIASNAATNAATFGLFNKLYDVAGIDKPQPETGLEKGIEMGAELVGGIAGTGKLLKGLGVAKTKAIDPVIDVAKGIAKKTPAPVKLLGGLGAGATAYETYLGATNTDYADQRDTLPSQLGATLRGSTGNTIETIGYSAERHGYTDLSNRLKAAGQQISKGYEVKPVQGGLTLSNVMNPDWWVNNIASSIPAMAMLIPIGIGGYWGGKGAMAKLGASKFTQTVVGSLLGSAMSRPLESELESGGTFQDTGSKKAAQRVFNDNMKLIVLDAFQLGIAMTPAEQMAGKLLGKGTAQVSKLAFGAGTEALEEGYQGASQAQVSGQDTHSKLAQITSPTPELKEAMFAGGIYGTAMTAAGMVNDMMSNIKARTITELPDAVMPEVEAKVQENIANGMPPAAAVDAVLDEIVVVPEIKDVVTRITQEEAAKATEKIAAEVLTKNKAGEATDNTIYDKNGNALQIVDRPNPEFYVVQNQDGQRMMVPVDEVTAQHPSIATEQAETQPSLPQGEAIQSEAIQTPTQSDSALPQGVQDEQGQIVPEVQITEPELTQDTDADENVALETAHGKEAPATQKISEIYNATIAKTKSRTGSALHGDLINTYAEINGISKAKAREEWATLIADAAKNDTLPEGMELGQSSINASQRDRITELEYQGMSGFQSSSLKIKQAVKKDEVKADNPEAKARRTTGKTATAKTERGTSIDVQYAVVDADSLIASHSTELKTNAEYPQELQPRDRGRMASEAQITRIANYLEPEFLGESPKVSEGAPIIGSDMVVESGNGRVIAIKRVYERGNENSAKYQQWLADNADKFGLKKEDLAGIKNPVLVRIRQGEIDRPSFVKEANEQSVAAMSATEQGKADAERITPGMMSVFSPSEDGQIINKGNQFFIREFMGKVVGPNEQGRYATSDGSISQEGVTRIRNAIFAKAYENAETLEKLAESTDNNVKNVTNAMLIAAPKMAMIRAGIKAGELYPLDITDEIAATTNKLSQLREQGVEVARYLDIEKGDNLFGEKELSPLSKDILDVFDKYKRSSKSIAKVLNDYADGVAAVGSPKQGGLWGESSPPTKAEVLDASLSRMEGRDGQEQASLFGDETVRSEENRKINEGTGQAGARGKKATTQVEENDILKENHIAYNEDVLLREGEKTDAGKSRLRSALKQLAMSERLPISNSRGTVDRHGGVKTIALGITKDAAKTGRIDLRGKKAASAKRIATLAQVFRNPSYETFRIFYLKDNTIVAHEAVTTRLPGSCALFSKDNKRSIYEMKRRMQRLGADGYYLLHNHPSGHSKLSKEDIGATQFFASNVSGFKGHVVINSNEYSYYHPAHRIVGKDGHVKDVAEVLKTEKVDFSKGEPDSLHVPAVDHVLLGQAINSDSSLALMAKELQMSKDMVALIYTDSPGYVRAVQEVPNGLFNDLAKATDYVRGRSREFGARQVFAITESADLWVNKARELVKKGVLQDAIRIMHSDYESAFSDPGVQRYAHINSADKWMGKKNPKYGSRVQETDLKFKRELAPVFYSQLQRVIEAKMPNKAIPNQILAIIKGGQVKQEEIKWSGIEDWLKEQDGKVSKQDVLEYLRANDVQVEEVEPSSTEYDQYQLPGGENYRELLFTMPGNELVLKKGLEIKQNEDGSWNLFDRRGEPVYKKDAQSKSEIVALATGDEMLDLKPGASYKSGHWSEPNVLAHVRFNDRTNDEGDKVLFIEEVQSDWHQEGRQKGYKGDSGKIKAQLAKEYNLPTNADEWSLSVLKRAGVPEDMQQEWYDAVMRGKVPDAPFKTTWHEFVLKRMVRYAAENGYDRIAWTTGEQQAERYDLSKQVDSIKWSSSDGTKYISFEGLTGSSGQPLEVYVNAETGIIKNGDFGMPEDWKGKHLSDVAGKELSEKILPESEGELKGDGLKIGGSGMAGFYDRMIPSFLNKYAKKWGAKVEASEIAARKEMEPEWVPDNYNLPEWLDEGYKFEYETKDGHYNYVGIYYSKEEDAWYAFKDAENLEAMVSKEDAERGAIKAAREDMNPEELLGGLHGLTVHSLPITEAMKKSVLHEGQPKFKADTILKMVSDEIGEKLEMAPEAMKRKNMQAANILAKIFTGNDIVPYKGPYQGFELDGTIFINEKTRLPLLHVVKHEIVHSLGTTDPEALQELMDIAKKYFNGNPEMQKYYTEKDYEPGEIWEEFTSDVTSEVMEEPGFWDMVREKSPAVINKVIDIIDRIISKYKKAVSKEESMLKYISDAEAFKAEVAGVTARTLSKPIRRNIFDLRTDGQIAAAKTKSGSIKSAKQDKISPTTNTNRLGEKMLDTPEFKEWFGDSKVVDEHGKPLVVYHGTNKDFSVFSGESAGDKTGNPTAGWGFFFTHRPAEASSYATDWTKEGGNVMPVYVSVKNPYIMPYSEYRQFTHLDNLSEGQAGLNRLADLAQQRKKELIEQGYDGIYVMQGDYDGKHITESVGEIVAFEPTQIKSVYNRGTWDASNPDIRMKRRSLFDLRTEKNSLIKGADGKPLLVYHGSMAVFDQFDEGKLGSNTGSSSAKEGFFFTDNPKLADFYGQSQIDPDLKAFSKRVEKMTDEEAQRLLDRNDDLQEAFFDASDADHGYELDNVTGEDIRKWLIDSGIETEANTADGALGNDFLDGIKEMRQYFKNANLSTDGIQYTKGTVKQVFLSMKKPYIHDYRGRDAFDDQGYSDIIKKAKQMGHDGVIIKNTRDPLATNLYIVFSKDQIVQPQTTPNGTQNKGGSSAGKSNLLAGVGAPKKQEVKLKRDESDSPGIDLPSQEVQAEFEASNGVSQTTMRENIAAGWDEIKRRGSRTFEWLPSGARFAKLKNALLLFSKQRNIAARKTINILDDITKPLSEAEYGVFRYKVVFDDLAAGIDAQEITDDMQLPFKLTKDNFAKNKEYVDEQANAMPNVMEAIEKRRQAWEGIKAEYIAVQKAVGYKVDKKLTRKDYYRHQILEYARDKGALFGTGKKLRTPTNRGFLRRREGSDKNFNTDYLQAEFEVMSQMIFDIEPSKIVKLVMDNYDVMEELKKTAAQQNDEGMLKFFQDMIDEHGIDSTPDKLYRKTLNKKQAIAFSQLYKMAAKGELPIGPDGKYEKVVQEMADTYYKNISKTEAMFGSEQEFRGELFAYLNYLSGQAESEQGQIKARTVFKGIAEKQRMMKNTLGKGYATWENLIPEGYVEWQPQEGHMFFTASSIPEGIANLLAEDILASAQITGDMLRQVMVVGQEYPSLVVPEEVALTLNDLYHAQHQDGLVYKAYRKAYVGWKQWQLISPRRFFKYNARNMTGDLDAVLAGNPKGMKKVPEAWKDLKQAFFSKDKVMSSELYEWFQRGGFDTLMQTQEISDINYNREFARIMESRTKKEFSDKNIGSKAWHKTKAGWLKYWDSVRVTTDFREAFLRYAMYLDYLEQMQENDGNPYNWGASNRDETMVLDDVRDRAAKLANELLGAYDEVSMVGTTLADNFLPFWRWQEVNFVRYKQLIKNACQDGYLMGSIAGKVAGMTIRSPFIAWKLGKFVFKASLLMAMITAWNLLRYPDEEKDLPADVRERVHIVLGRDKNGKVVYFSRLGAMQDFLDWFGIDTPVQTVRDFLNGRKSLKEIAIGVAKEDANKMINSLTPFIKTTGELLYGYKLFPDAFKKQRIRDRWQYMFESFGLGNEYKALAGKPTRGYGRSLWDLFIYKADPYESAYWGTLDEKRRFLKKIGKGSEGGYSITPRSEALYNIKLAARYGDKEAGKKYLLEYIAKGGTAKGLKQSLNTMNPLYGLSDAEKRVFVQQLDTEGKEDCVKALEYYARVISGKAGD